MIIVLAVAIAVLLLACVLLLVALRIVMEERDDLLAAIDRVKLGRSVSRLR